MDMRIDSELVKSEREKRAWSQEHLASVTGLGLRTITRIETTGRASHESVKALASVFQFEVSALKDSGNEARTAPIHIKWIRIVGQALITPIQLIDGKVSAKTNLTRLSITFSFLGAAIGCYVLGVKVGFVAFLIPAVVFELVFYYRLIHRSQPYA